MDSQVFVEHQAVDNHPIPSHVQWFGREIQWHPESYAEKVVQRTAEAVVPLHQCPTIRVSRSATGVHWICTLWRCCTVGR